MSATRFHDVTVVGGSLAGGLLAGLLAHRGLDVLWLGQADPGPIYQHQGVQLPAYLYWLPPAGKAPSLDQVLAELGLEDRVHLLGGKRQPLLQFLAPDYRIELSLDQKQLLAELARSGVENGEAVLGWLQSGQAAVQTYTSMLAEPSLVMPCSLLEKLRSRRHFKSLQVTPADSRQARPHVLELLTTANLFFCNLEPAQQHPLLARRWLLSLLQGMRPVDNLLQSLWEATERQGCEVKRSLVVEEIRPERGRAADLLLAGGERPRRSSVVVLALPPARGIELLSLGSGRGKFQALAGRVRQTGAMFTMNLVLPADKLPLGLNPTSLVLLPSQPGTDAQPEQLMLMHYRQLESRPGKVVVHLACRVAAGKRFLGRRALAAWQTRMTRAAASVMPFLEENLESNSSPFWEKRADDQPHPDPWNLHTIFETDSELFMGCALDMPRPPRRNILLIGPQQVPGLGLEGQALAALRLARQIEQLVARKKIL